MQRPPLTGILETCIYVEDVERSREFYGRIFGFKSMLEGESRICPLDVAPGQVLILFKRGGTPTDIPVGGGYIPAHDGEGRQHFAFAIPPGALEDWKTFLAEHDVQVQSEVNWPQGGRSIYFRDPDGLVVELATPGLWANY